MPLEYMFHEGGAMKPNRMYDWCFYIYHPSLKRHVLWDVGMRSVSEEVVFTPPVYYCSIPYNGYPFHIFYSSFELSRNVSSIFFRVYLNRTKTNSL
jgi:hypothetical protein